jgi:hypothetical protein
MTRIGTVIVVVGFVLALMLNTTPAAILAGAAMVGCGVLIGRRKVKNSPRRVGKLQTPFYVNDPH